MDFDPATTRADYRDIKKMNPATDEHALCSFCYAPSSYSITEKNNMVFLTKYCEEHGHHEIELFSDQNYWHCVKEMRTRINEEISNCMLIIEVVDECDIECPTCIAKSKKGMGNFRKREHLLELVKEHKRKHGKIPLLMISGGEPTLHPDLIGIIKELIPIVDQLMLITNGIKIANDERFAEELSKISQEYASFQIYLQFDSLDPLFLTELRGEDFREIRIKSLDNLKRYNIPVTLVCVVKKNRNDQEAADIVKRAAEYSNVRGVTFQPISAAGRHDSYSITRDRITLTELRANLLQGLNLPESSLNPHPLNPEQFCIGYFKKLGERIEAHPIDDQLYTTTQSIYIPDDKFDPIADYLRVSIISFLDYNTWTKAQSSRSVISFLTDTGDIIPLDQYFE